MAAGRVAVLCLLLVAAAPAFALTNGAQPAARKLQQQLPTGGATDLLNGLNLSQLLQLDQILGGGLLKGLLGGGAGGLDLSKLLSGLNLSQLLDASKLLTGQGGAGGLLKLDSLLGGNFLTGLDLGNLLGGLGGGLGGRKLLANPAGARKMLQDPTSAATSLLSGLNLSQLLQLDQLLGGGLLKGLLGGASSGGSGGSPLSSIDLSGLLSGLNLSQLLDVSKLLTGQGGLGGLLKLNSLLGGGLLSNIGGR